MDIIRAYAVNNLCYIRARKMVPKGIVVHSTGANNPNLKRYVDCEAEVGRNVNGNHCSTGDGSVCYFTAVQSGHHVDVMSAF